MPVSQPPFNQDPSRSSWEYEITSSHNTLEGRAQALLNAVSTKDEVEGLIALLEYYKEILESKDGANLYIQDTQPNPIYIQDFMWIQTNVNEDGDFSFWFCKED